MPGLCMIARRHLDRADLDESPMAYRRLPEVLAEHSGSIKVLHTLRPFAVAMAGENEFDPFKD
jgi:tRNA-splicing ligase RtcB (3'-phosphate/5'-hydroxy nucleic acid ligase)